MFFGNSNREAKVRNEPYIGDLMDTLTYRSAVVWNTSTGSVYLSVTDKFTKVSSFRQAILSHLNVGAGTTPQAGLLLDGANLPNYLLMLILVMVYSL